MDKSEYKITLSKDIVEKIRKVAVKENLCVEELIQNFVIAKFAKAKPEKSLFPSVALIKEGLNLVNPIVADDQQILINQSMPSHQIFHVENASRKQVNPEVLQRRNAIEAQMSELSLLIETATEDKKNGYVMQYAQLASELNALL